MTKVVYLSFFICSSTAARSMGSWVEDLNTSMSMLYTDAIFARRAPYEPLSITRSFPSGGTHELTIASSAPVPEHPNITVVYSFGSATKLVRSSAICSMRFPNSSSRGQMSATTCAYFTLSLVVEGPGLRRTSRRMLWRLSFSLMRGQISFNARSSIDSSSISVHE